MAKVGTNQQLDVMTYKISDAFAAVLREQREELNRQFVAKSHFTGGLSGADFRQVLADLVDPIVASVAEVMPECTRGVATELFELSLELVGAGALGQGATNSAIARVWSNLLPTIPRLMSRDARVVAGSLSNAAFHISRCQPDRSELWFTTMHRLVEQCDGVPKLLDCAAIAAWRSGMVQYRNAAIAAAAKLPATLACLALGIPADADQDLPATLTHLQTSPWHNPQIKHDPPTLQLTRRVGDFRGFGGPFLRPPLVCGTASRLFVSDGTATWELLADCFGTLFHRLGDANIFRTQQKQSTRAPRPNRHGKLTWQGFCVTLPVQATLACNDHTLLVATPDSHRIDLYAAI
ncbi:MAG: hypothetical protein R3C53_14095 [Pirellulaceae bacterium]